MATTIHPIMLGCFLVLAGVSGQQPFCEEQTGMGRDCFSAPVDCAEGDCEMTMTSQVVDNTTIMFEVTGKSEGWIAIGFSSDTMMGMDDVLMCRRSGSDVELLDRYNDGRRNIAKENSKIEAGIELTSRSYTNGVISCTFNRSVSIEDQQHFGLDTDIFHLLVGRGPNSAEGDEPAMHRQNPWASESGVDWGSSVRIMPAQADPVTQSMDEGEGPMPTDGSMSTHTNSILLLVFAATSVLLLLTTSN